MPRASCLLLLAVATGGQAATEVVLQDGQRILGAGVERRDDVYVIELESGGLLTLPVDLVAEVRLAAGPAEASPRQASGWTYTEPRQLAGDPLTPLDPGRALEALGRPAAFRPNLIDPNWTPRSGFPDLDVLLASRSRFRSSLIDPIWIPRSGFPDVDVLLASRSSFPDSIIDSTWIPEDGFARRRAGWGTAPQPDVLDGAHQRITVARNLSQNPTPSRAGLEWARVLEKGGWYRGSLPEPGVGIRFDFDLFADRPSDRSARVRGCAREILVIDPAKPAPESRKVDDPRYALLPLDVFEAGLGGTRAVFTVAEDACRAIGGDLRDALGVPLSREQAIAEGLEAYNASLGERIGVELITEQAKIAYASAVVAVVDPDVSGHARGSLLVVPDADALEVIVERVPEHCATPPAARLSAARQAARSFAPPRVAQATDGERVELYTWSSVGGEIVRHSIRLAPDGKVSVGRQTIASHVGEHVDRE